MCFHTTERQKAKIAKEDITCYKTGRMLDKGFVPSYQGDFTYVANIKPYNVILQKERVVSYWGRADYVINRGYHSYTTRRMALAMEDLEDIGIFIIPKGTSYYHNRGDREYVSETIVWTGEIIK